MIRISSTIRIINTPPFGLAAEAKFIQAQVLIPILVTANLVPNQALYTSSDRSLYE
jgi:hypothetical protein